MVEEYAEEWRQNLAKKKTVVETLESENTEKYA